MRALLDAIPDLMFRITADGTYVDFVGDAELLANPGRMSSAAGWTTCCRRRSPAPDGDDPGGARDAAELQTLGYVLPTIRGDGASSRPGWCRSTTTRS